MPGSDKINEMKDKARRAMSGDQGQENVDKAAEKAKDETGNKHDDQIDKGAQAMKDKMGKSSE